MTDASDLIIQRWADRIDKAVCPDCNQPWASTHPDSCPFMAELERIVALDKAWFEQHPLATAYFRPITSIEQQERRIVHFGNQARFMEEIGPYGKIKVIKISDTQRMRSHDTCWWVFPHDPEQMRWMASILVDEHQLPATALIQSFKPGEEKT